MLTYAAATVFALLMIAPDGHVYELDSDMTRTECESYLETSLPGVTLECAGYVELPQ